METMWVVLIAVAVFFVISVLLYQRRGGTGSASAADVRRNHGAQAEAQAYMSDMQRANRDSGF